GAGSTLAYTQNLRRALPLLLTQLGVKRVLDAPCGDYHWFRFIERPPEMHYVGADIVKPLIVQNREHYENETTTLQASRHHQGPAARGRPLALSRLPDAPVACGRVEGHRQLLAKQHPLSVNHDVPRMSAKPGYSDGALPSVESRTFPLWLECAVTFSRGLERR